MTESEASTFSLRTLKWAILTIDKSRICKVNPRLQIAPLLSVGADFISRFLTHSQTKHNLRNDLVTLLSLSQNIDSHALSSANH